VARPERSVKHLREQVERIIDEGVGTRRSVIVRMAEPGADIGALIGTAGEAIRARRLSQTARDILPSQGEAVREKTSGLSPRNRRALASDHVSASAQVAAAGVRTVTKNQLVASGHRAVRPLLASDVAQKGLRASERKGKTSGTGVFWSSRSAVLELGTDELARLPEEVEAIADIAPNRRLRIPPVVEVKNLPSRAADNKASAWGVYRIGAMSAWGAYDARGKGVTVGVLDTGVDGDHPDLKGKISAWAEFDGAGRQIPGSKAHDSDQHGTHVAGTIVGGDGSGRWIGVAPQAKIAAALVLDGRNGGTDAQVLAGIDWALEQGVNVISMSLGALTFDPQAPTSYSAAVLTALRAGVPVVAAIGNEGHQTSGSPGNDLFAFAVGATDPEDRPAGFSGGRTQVLVESSFIDQSVLPLPYSKPEVSAPGVAVESSVPGGGWAAFSGTSMATPHVAGAMALVLSATSNLRSVESEKRAFLLQDLLIGSVEELGESGQDHRFGFGRIDVLRAIGFARGAGF
jgi:subtilisin family serine protease